MLLAIDIGNTNITFGIFEGDKIIATSRMATIVDKMPDEYGIILYETLNHRKIDIGNIKAAILCSTVPPLVPIFTIVCERYLNLTPLVVGAGIKTGVAIRMDNPREVGTDRITNAVAARHLYEGPTIVIDVGTATTFDVVSKDGAFIGGAIATGIGTAAEALYQRTAALPRVEFTAPKHAIGTNTVAAMQSGVIFGYVGLIEGMVRRMTEELGEKPMVVATGGHATLMAGQTEIIDEINPDITLTGLKLIYEMNKS